MNHDEGTLHPFTPNNKRLEANVHPRDWVNPTATGKYNLVVIGAGTAGLVSAAAAAGLGGKVALIERQLMGGDCLNVGCVPSKAIISSALAAAAIRSADSKGIHIDPSTVKIDFPGVMERMRQIRADISPHDSAERFKNLGIDVYFGCARFTTKDRVEVAGQELHFAKAVICTGARASVPAIPGLTSVPYLTNETLFSLIELPRSMAIVGAGPIGVEMAQAFARLGSRVTLIIKENGVLPREDPEAALLVKLALENEGVTIQTGGEELILRPAPNGQIRCSINSQNRDFLVDRLLLAAGRSPNIEDLDLSTAGVDYAPGGIIVNDRLRTTNPRIYAAGDVCSRFKFTHAADFMARTVIRNALFGGRAKASSLIIPWATYTSPEVAHVGPLHQELQKMPIDTYRVDLKTVDRAILEAETNGFVKVHCHKGTGTIVAATIVAKNAGDMISQISQAMTAKTDLGTIARTISPYPTQAEAIRRAGDAYNRTRLTPTVANLMKKWLKFSRR